MPWDRINLGDFQPDVADYNVEVAQVAKNVVPVPGGYKSVRDLAAVQSATFTQSSYTQPVGFWFTRSDLTTAQSYAGYDMMFAVNNSGQPKFFRGGSEFQKTSALSQSSANFFQISPVQWDDTLYIWGDVSPPQKIDQADIVSGTGKTIDTPGSPPEAEFAVVVRQQMVVGKTYESSTLYTRRVRWSAFGDPEGWTNGTNQAGQEDLRDGGIITGLMGGEYGIIFQESKVTRMNYIGAPNVWEFDPLIEAKGCPASRSIVKVGTDIYYWGGDGFYVLRDGTRSEPISVGVNEWIRREAATNTSFELFPLTIKGAYDPGHNQIWWAFATSYLGLTGQFEADTIIVYDINTGRFSTVKPFTHPTDQERIVALYTRPPAADDDFAEPLRFLPSVGLLERDQEGADELRQKTFESDTVLAAELETGLIFTQGAKTYIRGARPLCDVDMDVALITRADKLSDTETTSSSVSPDSYGVCDFTGVDEARYHRVKLIGGTSDDFDKCAGVMVDWEPSGEY